MVKDKFNICVDLDNKAKYSLDIKQPTEDIYDYNFTFINECFCTFSSITIKWSYPLKDAHYYWFPLNDRLRKLRTNTHEGMPSKAAVSAPVSIYYNNSGYNRLTCALSDPLNTIILSMGVREENAQIICKAELFTLPTKPQKEYNITLRLDCRDIPYYKSLQDISSWWENDFSIRPTHVPDYAKMPMYSTWYSFHQIMSDKALEQQCNIASSIGCSSIIVDDGWQTADINRGYAYTGDWEVCIDKFPDMKKHVAKVHEMGMKYILWYSVAYVGSKSKVYDKLKDKTLYLTERNSSATLDPRYKEVREYIIGIYEKALIDWDLDGFKLDFVDRFDLARCDVVPPVNKDMDFISLQEAVDELLSSTIKRLKAIKPDIMIEFRQKYNGPLMRKYGNIFRVGDCPGDYITNRAGICDIRLLSGSTVAHSDMIMWNEVDSVESAALQITNVIFGVPQISMLLDNLPKDHFEMLIFWLSFVNKHRDVLLDGAFEPLYPEQQYPIVIASNDNKKIIAVYSEMIVKTNFTKSLIIVNGKLTEQVYVDFYDQVDNVRITIQNSMGHIVSQDYCSIKKGIQKMSIPANGIAYIESI